MERQHSSRHFVWMAAVAGLYFAAGRLGLSLAFLHPSASPVWPASGIALAFLLLLGSAIWPAVFMGAFLVNITTAGTVATSLGIATGNTLEALLGAYLVNRFAGGRKTFDRPEDTLKFVVLAALLATAVSATVGVTIVTLGGTASLRSYANLWLTWWLGDAVGVLVVTPLLVLWSEGPRWRMRRGAFLESALLFVVLLTVGWIIFTAPRGQGTDPMVYLSILPVVWAVLRFGRREGATAVLALSAIAIAGTLRGLGPFSGKTPNESLLHLQAFLGILAVVSNTVGSVIAQRGRSIAGLQAAQEDLEEKVEERYRALLIANAELRKSEQRFRSLLESAPDARVIFNPEGRIVLVNAQTEKVFGYRREELLGASIETLLPECFHEEQRSFWEDFFAAPRVRSMGDSLELSGRRKDGGRFPVDLSLSPLETEKGILVSAAIRDVSRRRKSEESMARLAAIVGSSDDAIFSTDMEGVITSWNSAAEKLFGYTAAEVLGQPARLLVPPGQHHEATQDLERLKRGARVRSEARRMRKDGSLIDVWLSLSPVKDVTGRIVGSSAILRDIGEQKQVERERQEQEILRSRVEHLSKRTHEIALLNDMGEMLRSALSPDEAYPVVPRFLRELFPSESGTLYQFNERHNLLEGVVSWGESPPGEDGFRPSECWALRRGQVHHVEASGKEMICSHWKATDSSSSFCVPLAARGTTFGLLHLVSAPLPGGETSNEHVFGEYQQRMARSVAQQISSALFDLRLQETLRLQASRDPLTGLLNRRSMEEALHRELYRAARKKSQVGFVLFDLDRFKEFNDRFGHAAGDAALCALSAFVQERCRAEDILCRYGGEEFLLVLADCTQKDLLRRAEQIREGVKQIALEHQGGSGRISVSIGVALFPDHGRTSRDLFQAADAALYRAKKGGRDRVVIAGANRWSVDRDAGLEAGKEH